MISGVLGVNPKFIRQLVDALQAKSVSCVVALNGSSMEVIESIHLSITNASAFIAGKKII